MELKRKIAIIVNSQSYERVVYALNIANALQSMGFQVAMLFAYGAVKRLSKRHVDEVGDETEPKIRDEIREGVKTGKVIRISEALMILKELGGKVYACPSAMILHGMNRDDLIEVVDGVKGLVEFLREHALDASQVIYV